MDSIHMQRLERAFSSGECSTSRSVPGLPIRRLNSLPAPGHNALSPHLPSLSPQSSGGVITRAMSRASSVVSSMGTLEATVLEQVEPETEILTEDRLPETMWEYRDHVAALQNLERVKGKLRNSLYDLDYPDLEDTALNLDDWTKLRAARREHQAELSKLHMEEAQKLEQRKRQRALKREARKAQALLSGNDPNTTVTALSRRATSFPASGARATARSRTRTNARWGRTSEPLDPNMSSLKTPEWNGVSDNTSQTISSHKLLTGKEEIELSKKVQDWIKLERVFNELTEKLGRKPNVTEWAKEFGEKDERLFMERVVDGSAARTRMLTCNQRLVVSIARKYQNKGMEMMDLIQEGMVGLLRGVEKFDHTKGFKFSTYATWWIRQSITRSIMELSRMIRLPAHLNEMLGKISKIEREFNASHMRYPTDEEVAQLLGVNIKRVKMVKQANKAPTSIHENASRRAGNDAEAATVGELIEDQTMNDMNLQMVTNSMHRDVNSVLSTLSPREHGIIRMRYGLDDGQPKTLEEIGVAFHVTRERIRQIENKALANLKDPSRNGTLLTYVDGEAMSLLQDAGWKNGIQRDSTQ